MAYLEARSGLHGERVLLESSESLGSAFLNSSSLSLQGTGEGEEVKEEGAAQGLVSFTHSAGHPELCMHALFICDVLMKPSMGLGSQGDACGCVF